ncbi:integral membrane [Fusarium longipes]|uniref:Integral membrane n=1 Tax=Fusarium longipes TaxID=694270 RepID=A0A395SAH2_9HYPO|nr:integral membrane [Fusarium longipes]
MYLRWPDVRPRAEEDTATGSRSLEIRAVLATFAVLSATAVALRTWIRLKVLRSFGWDDGMMVVAQVLALGAAVAIGLENKYGLGYHTWEQESSAYVPYMKSFYASIIVYNVAICLVKIGILLQYRRVFAIQVIQLLTFYGTALMVVWTIVIAFLNILICVPVAKFWNAELPGTCLDPLLIWYIMAGYNLATDIAIFCLPLPVIKSLNLPRKQKVMLFAIFSLGFFTCVISIYRIQTLRTAAATKDPNWDNVDAAIWSFLEVTIAIIAACLPTLRPIFSKLMPKMFASSYNRSNRASRYTQPRVSLFLANQPRTRTGQLSKVFTDDASTLSDDTSPISPKDRVLTSSHNAAVHVSIRAGNEKLNDDDVAPACKGGGITAKTVITQSVLEEESWDSSRPSCSNKSF